MVADRKTDRVSPAMKQMKEVIERYVRSSLNGDLYEKAFECLQELRKAAIAEDEAPNFNSFMHKIKDNYSTGAHSAFFSMLQKLKLSLITTEESEISSVVTKQEAQIFLSTLIQKPQPAKVAPKQDEDFDLLD